MVTDCIFATYDGLPNLDPHDRLLADHLRERGVSVEPGVWNDPMVDWGSARMCVLRSTWDYHRSHAAFMDWLDEIAAKTLVRNDPDLVRWNSHKFYLRDLEQSGIPIVPTVWLNCGEQCNLEDLSLAQGWSETIIKPAHGASSADVLHVRSGDLERRQGQEHLEQLLSAQDVLVQPFLHTLADYPERALIFIDGIYSHAVTKTPYQKALESGEAGDAPLVQATADELQVAAKAVSSVPGTLFARVDLVRDTAGQSCVLELELIEPTLFLSVYPLSAERLADTIVRELRT